MRFQIKSIIELLSQEESQKKRRLDHGQDSKQNLKETYTSKKTYTDTQNAEYADHKMQIDVVEMVAQEKMKSYEVC